MAMNSPVSDFQTFLEGAGFESGAVGAVQVDDVVAERTVAIDDELGHFFGFVGGVVEDLNVEEIAGVVEAADGLDEAVDDELLVEDGELDGDAGELVEAAGGLVGGVLPVMVILPDQLVAVQSIDGEHDHDGEVGSEEEGIEGEELPVVEVLEGVIAVMGAEVVAEVVFDKEESEGLGRGCEEAGCEGQEHEEPAYSG